MCSQLRGFDKESHAKSLANGIIPTCKSEFDLRSWISKANKMVPMLRAAGCASFFAAAYPKVFQDSSDALTTRSRLIVDFQMQFCLTEIRAARLADCIVFSAAKRQDREAVGRLAKIASATLEAGIPFEAVADVVYFSSPDVSPCKFANRCIDRCFDKGVVPGISKPELVERLSV